MRKLQKMAKALHEEFRNDLSHIMRSKFNIGIETTWDIISGQVISRRVDGKDFTKAQTLFMETYESGYLHAIRRIEYADTGRLPDCASIQGKERKTEQRRRMAE